MSPDMQGVPSVPEELGTEFLPKGGEIMTLKQTESKISCTSNIVDERGRCVGEKRKLIIRPEDSSVGSSISS